MSVVKVSVCQLDVKAGILACRNLRWIFIAWTQVPRTHLERPKCSTIPPHTMQHASTTQDLQKSWNTQKQPVEGEPIKTPPAAFQLSTQQCQPSLQSIMDRNQVPNLTAGRCRWYYNHVAQCCGEPCLVHTSCSGKVQLPHWVLSSCVQLTWIPAPHCIWQFFLGNSAQLYMPLSCVLFTVWSLVLPDPHQAG